MPAGQKHVLPSTLKHAQPQHHPTPTSPRKLHLESWLWGSLHLSASISCPIKWEHPPPNKHCTHRCMACRAWHRTVAGDSRGPVIGSTHGHTTMPQSRCHTMPNPRLLDAEAGFQREVKNVLHSAGYSSNSHSYYLSFSHTHPWWPSRPRTPCCSPKCPFPGDNQETQHGEELKEGSTFEVQEV